MAITDIAPTVSADKIGKCDPHEVLNHPAFGTVVLTHPTGSERQLFGSEVGHLGCVRIEVQRAELHRNLSRDWTFSKDPIVTFEMTHSQFAAFITGAGRGEGTPVTLVRAPTSPAVGVPGIRKVESAQDTYRREIRAAAASRFAHMLEEIKRLEDMIESGKTPKKVLKEVTANLKRHVQQAPGSIEFVLESAEEALEQATNTAKIEVEAFIDSRARAIGYESMAHMAASLAPPAQAPGLDKDRVISE